MTEPLIRILNWCSAHAPRTREALVPPRASDALADAQRRTGDYTWPDDVLDFYRSCDGTERTPAGYLLPGHRPFSLPEIVETWHWLLNVAEDCLMGAFVQPAEAVTLPAGSYIAIFIDAWLPIAENQSGSYLVVDRRGGDERGRITEIDPVEWDGGDVHWSSLTALLDATATAVESGTPVAENRRGPVVDDGCLLWRRSRPPA